MDVTNSLATSLNILDGGRPLRRKVGLRLCCGLLLLLVLAPAALLYAAPPEEAEGPIRHVILISVDGLRPDAITRLGPDRLPNFYRLQEEGASTDNARTDADYSVTLPNHMAQLTGRPVAGPEGHNWTSNSDPGAGETLHSNKGAYVTSVFDVVQDSGLRTGAYVSKSKFELLNQSYGPWALSPEGVGQIESFVYDSNTEMLTARFLRDLRDEPFSFAFLHLRDPDRRGHMWGWRLWKHGPYMRAIRKVDRLLGEILETIEEDPRLAGSTAVILTADHGGSSHHHADISRAEHYTVPFYVWGPGVPNADLYALNPETRQDPGAAHPGFDAEEQPIRNGDAANLALSLLGLDHIPGSTINRTEKLEVGRASEAVVETGGSPDRAFR